MIRLVISDMDGTIIGRNEQVPAEAAEFISNLEAHGILFTIATGRSEGYMQSKIKQMGIRHPYIATNGATNYEWKLRCYEKTIFHRTAASGSGALS